MPPRDRADGDLPSREEILRFIAVSEGEVTKRDLVRAFKIRGAERTAFKHLLRELEAEGALERGRRQRLRPEGRLPSVAVIEITGLDDDGELRARPLRRGGEADPSQEVVITGRLRPAPGPGDRVLVRLRHQGGDAYEASVIKIIGSEPRRVIGRLERSAGELRVRPIDTKARLELMIDPADAAGASPGEMVLAERLDGSPLGLPKGKILECLGEPGDPRSISIMSAHLHGLPVAFPGEVDGLAAAAEPVALAMRTDLRELPLVTIDGADARDFDDAVFARPDPDPVNPEGFEIVVAIADVAHYVRPGDALDREARRRGNSVYFPDRVIPMLPEPLSNGLCSLRPDEERACLAVRMHIDPRGRKLKHRFVRGLMRSRARLTYEQVQNAIDGNPDDQTAPLHQTLIGPLEGAFRALLLARDKRGTLDLDIPELQVEIGPDGRPAGFRKRPRLDSHRLIEEFMILANVAAAETLEAKAMPCMYRIHDKPDAVKMEALGQLLQGLELTRSSGSIGTPKDLQRLLARVEGHELAPLISTFVLRAQSQARYDPRNIGHFGLHLGRYAHFTSPIRRYADLLVHRALIRALGLGAGGLEDGTDNEVFSETGDWISRTERRAMEAERLALSRFMAFAMREREGAHFEATVTSVHRFGVFIQLDETGADGLVPIATLGREYFHHDATRHALVGDTTGEVVALGDRCTVELTDVDTLTGQLGFRMLSHVPGALAALARKEKKRGGSEVGRRFRRRR